MDTCRYDFNREYVNVFMLQRADGVASCPPGGLTSIRCRQGTTSDAVTVNGGPVHLHGLAQRETAADTVTLWRGTRRLVGALAAAGGDFELDDLPPLQDVSLSELLGLLA